MSPWIIKRLFPHASASLLAANEQDYTKADSAGPAPVVERLAGAGPLATGETQKGDTVRVLVRLTSVRRRLLDEDNLCEKYHVDCCRYSGILRSDEPGKTKIEVSQRKAGKGEAEHTIIEILIP